jgi:hypothetical protein
MDELLLGAPDHVEHEGLPFLLRRKRVKSSSSPNENSNDSTVKKKNPQNKTRLTSVR